MEKQFVNGIRAFKPNDNAPEFVIANLEINKNELLAFLNGQPDKIKVDMKRSQKGGFYLEVNTWQPKQDPQQQKREATKNFYQPSTVSNISNQVPVDDLPF
jgi:hypothetical protein